MGKLFGIDKVATEADRRAHEYERRMAAHDPVPRARAAGAARGVGRLRLGSKRAGGARILPDGCADLVWTGSR